MSKQTYCVYSTAQKHMCMYGAVVHEFTNADTDKHYFSLAWPCLVMLKVQLKDY